MVRAESIPVISLWSAVEVGGSHITKSLLMPDLFLALHSCHCIARHVLILVGALLILAGCGQGNTGASSAWPTATFALSGDPQTAAPGETAVSSGLQGQQLPIQDADLNTPGPNGWTPLHGAAAEGRVEVAKQLMAQGADPNIPTHSGRTPLHLAALEGHVAIAEQLLTQGANLHALDDLCGFTPLHLAAIQDYIAMAEWLLAQGANPNAPDHYGSTPLHWVAGEGQVAMVEQWLAQGANPNALDSHGHTPLHAANAMGHDAVVRLLQAAGAE